MRKRVLYSLLAAIMIVAMLPGLAFPASAASQMTASEDLVDFIKEHEGFRSEATAPPPAPAIPSPGRRQRKPFGIICWA